MIIDQLSEWLRGFEMSDCNINPFLESKKLKRIILNMPEESAAFLKDVYNRMLIAEQEKEYLSKMLKTKEEEILSLNGKIKQLAGMVKV